MYIIKDKKDMIIAISDTLDYQSNGNPLINHGMLAIAESLVGNVEETNVLPEGWMFDETINEYTRIPETPDPTIEERLNDIELAILELAGVI